MNSDPELERRIQDLQLELRDKPPEWILGAHIAANAWMTALEGHHPILAQIRRENGEEWTELEQIIAHLVAAFAGAPQSYWKCMVEASKRELERFGFQSQVRSRLVAYSKESIH